MRTFWLDSPFISRNPKNYPSERGQYITNPNNALCFEHSSLNILHTCVLFHQPKMPGNSAGDLFGMVKWPLERLRDLQRSGIKGGWLWITWFRWHVMIPKQPKPKAAERLHVFLLFLWVRQGQQGFTSLEVWIRNSTIGFAIGGWLNPSAKKITSTLPETNIAPGKGDSY